MGYEDHAELYDIAFSWDIEREVDWLLSCLGEGRSFLEPFCGTGRLLASVGRRGVEVAGVDRSPAMLAVARRRLRELGVSDDALHRADVTDFDLGRRFGGAACLINSFGYLLTRADALAHLQCMGRHLEAGARYVLQVDLRDTAKCEPRPVDSTSQWEMQRDGVRVRTTSQELSFDRTTSLEKHLTRFEVLDGPDTGRVFEDSGAMRLWSWEAWSDLVAESPFEQVAACTVTRGTWRTLPVGPELEEVRLAYHVLRR